MVLFKIVSFFKQLSLKTIRIFDLKKLNKYKECSEKNKITNNEESSGQW